MEPSTSPPHSVPSGASSRPDETRQEAAVTTLEHRLNPDGPLHPEVELLDRERPARVEAIPENSVLCAHPYGAIARGDDAVAPHARARQRDVSDLRHEPDPLS